MSDHHIVPADQILPARLFLIPLRGKPVFPGILTPLVLHAAADVEAVEKAVAADSFIGLSMVGAENVDNPTADDLAPVGTAAKIVRKINLPDGGVNVFISTVKRFRIKRVLRAESPISVVVQYIDDENIDTAEVKALTRALLSEMKQISENNPLFSEEMRLSMVTIDHPGKIADFVTSVLNIERGEQQKILETANVQQRMEKVLIFIKKEQELLKIQKKIQEQLNEKISKSQREDFLKEELKAELGMAVDSRALTGEVKEQVEQELEKRSLMEASSPEFGVTRNYLETIVSLPWNDDSAESLDKAKRILDEDHDGLDDVKERILKYLSVRKLKQDAKGSIICLVGPPGVGKTSVGKSIARALGRTFFRFSVGRHHVPPGRHHRGRDGRAVQMRPHVAAFAAALALGLQLSGFALGRQPLPHPGFSLTLRDLKGLVAVLPEQSRTAIAARPSDFLELMRDVLAGPQDLFVLVDKTRALTADDTPPDLVALSRSTLRASRSDMQLREVLIADLLAMSEAASAAGAPLVVSSAWRSYKYQEGLFARALERQPLEQVEMTLARPGHSQHQLGTAIDFGSIDISFADTKQGKWLFAHASSFGFSLSYPRGMEGSTGYSWEPWHYRYVGRGAARLIDEFFGGMQQDFLSFYAQNSAAFSRKLRR